MIEGMWRLLAPLAAFFLVALICCGMRDAAAEQPPADGWIVWQSNRRDGRTEIYLAKADGTGIKRLTRAGAQQPTWAPGGRWIAYANQTGAATYVVRPDGSGAKKLFSGKPMWWMHDSSGLVCRSRDDFHLVDPETGAARLLFRKRDFPAVGDSRMAPWPGGGGITHDGRYLVVGSAVYRNGHSGTNGSFKANFAASVFDLLHKEKVFFFGDGCWPVTPPAGDLIYHVCGNCKTKPDIYRMSLNDLMSRKSYAPEKAEVDGDWGHEYNPRISNDNRWLAFMSSSGCHAGYDCDYEIFLHRLGADPKSRVRVTHDRAFDGYPDLYVGALWKPPSGPRLLLIPTAITFFVERPKTVATKSRVLVVRNAGQGALGPASAKVSDGTGSAGGGRDPWFDLSVSPAASPAQEQTITITPNARVAFLAAGRYEAEVLVSARGENSPQTAKVTLVLSGQGLPPPDSGVSKSDTGPTSTDGPIPSNEGCAVDGQADNRSGAPSPLLLSYLLLGWLARNRKSLSRRSPPPADPD